VPESEKLFNFLDLELQDVTREFIERATHPQTNPEELHRDVHIRDPEEVINKWKHKLSMKEINQLQHDCGLAMNLWGYLHIKNNNISASGPTYKPNFSL